MHRIRRKGTSRRNWLHRVEEYLRPINAPWIRTYGSSSIQLITVALKRTNAPDDDNSSQYELNGNEQSITYCVHSIASSARLARLKKLFPQQGAMTMWTKTLLEQQTTREENQISELKKRVPLKNLMMSVKSMLLSMMISR